MDFSNLLTSLQTTLGETLPSLGGALLILVGGWFVALVVRCRVSDAAARCNALHSAGVARDGFWSFVRAGSGSRAAY